jgi:hypothetical protein
MSQGVKRRQGFWAGELECATRCGRMRRVNEDALKKKTRESDRGLEGTHTVQ